MGNPSLCPGRELGVSVLLDENVSGFIKRDELSDEMSSFNKMSEILQIGQNQLCRVLEFEPDRFSCKLSVKGKTLREGAGETAQNDEFWDEARENEDKKVVDASKKRTREKTQFTKRVISHQSFHNVTFADAERMLSTMSQVSESGERRPTCARARVYLPLMRIAHFFV